MKSLGDHVGEVGAFAGGGGGRGWLVEWFVVCEGVEEYKSSGKDGWIRF
jgi:hypothetical protein